MEGTISKRWLCVNSGFLLIFLAIILVDLIPSIESKQPKHKHGDKKKDKEKEDEEDKDKKIRCLECKFDTENCTETNKECKYCFTFNATTVVEKGCLKKEDSDDIDTDECSIKLKDGINGTICYCDDDLCNEVRVLPKYILSTSSSEIYFAKLSLVLMFLFALLLIN